MNSSLNTPEASLRNLRLVWGAIIASELVIAGVLTVLAVRNGTPGPDAHLGRLSLYITTGLFVALTLAGYFVRNQIYKRHWREHAIKPEGYFTGNMALLAMMEVVVIVGLVLSIMVSRMVFPTLYPALAAMGVQLVNFPTGEPMKPMPPAAAQQHHTER